MIIINKFLKKQKEILWTVSLGARNKHLIMHIQTGQSDEIISSFVDLYGALENYDIAATDVVLSISM